MPFPPPIREKIRRQIIERHDAGRLPTHPSNHMFAGYGTGLPCAACDELIQPDEVEYEFDTDHGAFPLHLGCAGLWQAECRRRRTRRRRVVAERDRRGPPSLRTSRLPHVAPESFASGISPLHS
jgi:hypothetical protein